MKRIKVKKSGRLHIIFVIFVIAGFFRAADVPAGDFRAGVGVVNITAENPTMVIRDSLYVKTLVLDDGTNKAAIITVDAIAIGRIGEIGKDYLPAVRRRAEKELDIKKSHIMANASHNHRTGNQICADVVDKTLKALKCADKNMTRVKIGSTVGHEDRIMMNRRLKLVNGKEWTIRHANPCPPDEEIAGLGPIDPEIGILRIEGLDGKTIAVLYNFTTHPYTGVPGGGVTAELSGFASQVIEENSDTGTVALFLQGACGDITEVLYKDVNSPRDAEPFGRMLGLSTMRALNRIKTKDDASLSVITQNIALPLRTDIPERVRALESEQSELLNSLRNTSLNFKAFLPLYLKHSLNPEFPSYYSYRYLQEEKTGVEALKGMDAENRRNLKKYLANITAMEKLARNQGNLNMLRQRQEEIEDKPGSTIDIEVQAMRIGDYVLVTFPGELFVEIGMNIKNNSPFEFTFIASYSNGYMHYGPTAGAYTGEAYEVTNCIIAPEWQAIYEGKVAEMLSKL